MKDAVEKTILTSIGLLSLTKQKVEEVAEELVKKGKLSHAQGREVIDQFLAAGQQQAESLTDRVSQAVADVLDRMQLVQRKDFEALEKRVERLEKQE
jgi:polyhydroxyalkanoate synthesis regulator phasin